MPNAPHGPWTPLLIGHHWPDSSTLEALAAGARNRHAVGAAFDSYAESLRATSQGLLGFQEGATAADAREAFSSGELHARTVAEKNITRKAALERAHSVTAEFRSQLAEIAERGNSLIRAILDSKQARGEKVSQIAELVAQTQTEANIRAAACSQEMLGSIQTVLDQSRLSLSAREFARAHGVDVDSPYTATHSEAIRRQVDSVLSTPKTGGLAAYGDGVRPPPMAAPPSATAGAPGSAPVRNQLGYPAVVRHQGGPRVVAAAAFPKAHSAERAVADRAPAADHRLRRILAAVARQEPLLRWMIGDTGDGSIVLATDLADGWIPPHVDIPAGVSLLAPAARRVTPLGPIAHSLTYLPGQHLPPADADLVPSPDARRTRPVADLGRELARAIAWRRPTRDLTAVAREVLSSYPAAVDRTEVGDWQLLASVDAFTKGAVMLANYHFSWFRASAFRGSA